MARNDNCQKTGVSTHEVDVDVTRGPFLPLVRACGEPARAVPPGLLEFNECVFVRRKWWCGKFEVAGA